MRNTFSTNGSAPVFNPWGDWNQAILAHSRSPFTITASNKKGSCETIHSIKEEGSGIYVVRQQTPYTFDCLQANGDGPIFIDSVEDNELVSCSREAYERIMRHNLMASVAIAASITLVCMTGFYLLMSVLTPIFNNLS